MMGGAALPAVVVGRPIVAVRREARRTAWRRHPGDEIIRHVTARPGVRMAFVLDRRGPDAVVIDTSAGEIRLDQSGEATHPSWSPDGRLVWSLGSAPTGVVSEDDDPVDIGEPPAIGLFSPVFAGTDSIIAVIAEPEPAFTRTEDEGLDNLWRYDLAIGRWTRVTAFRAAATGGRRRTPLDRDDGSLQFVRITVSSARRCHRSSSGRRLRMGSPRGYVVSARDVPRGDPGRTSCVERLRSGRGRMAESTPRPPRPSSWTSVAVPSPSTLRSVGDPDRCRSHRPTPSPTETPTPSPTPVSHDGLRVPNPTTTPGYWWGNFPSSIRPTRPS